MPPLSTLLFGQPLSDAGRGRTMRGDGVGRSLDRILAACSTCWGARRGRPRPTRRPSASGASLLGAEYDYAGIAARRAALLFALHALAPVRAHFAKREPELVADLETRVLPATIPSFLSGMAQRPEALVVMCSTLTSMWRENMGERVL